MSRLGKKPIIIPAGTEIKIAPTEVTVKGPLGELKKRYDPIIKIEVKDNQVILTPVRKSLEMSALWGTIASHIMNMIEGVNKPYEKKLVIEGIGYKAEIKGEDIILNLGFSHQIKIKIPKGLKLTYEKGVVSISGIDKDLVGRFAAEIRSLKKPEPYKGKGVHYSDEIVKRKEGKKTA